MKLVFDRDRISPELPGIVLLSHGELAPAMIRSAEMIVGEMENVAALAFEAGDTLEAFREKLGEIMDALPEGSIVLTDLFGGTPSNQLLMYSMASGHKVDALSGLNLSMLIDAVSFRETCSGDELLDNIESIAKESIVNITRRMEQIKND